MRDNRAPEPGANSYNEPSKTIVTPSTYFITDQGINLKKVQKASRKKVADSFIPDSLVDLGTNLIISGHRFSPEMGFEGGVSKKTTPTADFLYMLFIKFVSYNNESYIL